MNYRSLTAGISRLVPRSVPASVPPPICTTLDAPKQAPAPIYLQRRTCIGAFTPHLIFKPVALTPAPAGQQIPTHDRDPRQRLSLPAHFRPSGLLALSVPVSASIWAIICAGARPDGVLAVRLLPF